MRCKYISIIRSLAYALLQGETQRLGTLAWMCTVKSILSMIK